MNKERISIISNNKSKAMVEKIAALIFKACGLVSIIAVVSITIYMIIAGTPAIAKKGFIDILFNPIWRPTGDNPSFGILYIILTSIIGVFLAIVLGVPIGLLTAINLSEIARPRARKIITMAVELLAGIPSVIYGLLGVLLINPWMYQLELLIYKGSTTHQFTGGSNLLSAVIVLAIMILPTLINISQNALRSVPDEYRKSSLALGASSIQTIFKVVVPCAKPGLISAMVLAIGRAIGEAMAIVLVAGNVVNMPYPFQSVRFLTTAIVSEMGYAEGLHREVLFTIGLVLFIFVIVINAILTRIVKER